MTRLYTRLITSEMTRLIQHLIGLIVGSPTLRWNEAFEESGVRNVSYLRSIENLFSLVLLIFMSTPRTQNQAFLIHPALPSARTYFIDAL